MRLRSLTRILFIGLMGLLIASCGGGGSNSFNDEDQQTTESQNESLPLISLDTSSPLSRKLVSRGDDKDDKDDDDKDDKDKNDDNDKDDKDNDQNATDNDQDDINSNTSEGSKNHINYFRLSINTASSIDISVSYQTRNGSAKAGKDYLFKSGVAVIRKGKTQTLIGIEIIADTQTESAEEFFLVLTNPIGARFPTGVTEIVVAHTITDGDTSDSTTTGGQSNTGYQLTAWNDLGMHCLDSDFSVFSILPPFNNVNAQLIHDGKLLTSGVNLTYEAIADTSGSISTDSAKYSNFWDHEKSLFGVDLAENTGLTGNKTASAVPQAMAFNTKEQWFEATGIPRIPIDDNGETNAYPMVKVVAKDASGNVLASADIVTPVSDEMDCKLCHASSTSLNFAADAEPAQGWLFDPNPEKDFRRNILRLHDEKHSSSSTYRQALDTKGYNANGLLATADEGTAILCAGCHASNALPGTGITGIPPLTQAIHSKHASVAEPTSGKRLDSINDRTSCYLCHPGNKTQCLRGAMGQSKDSSGHDNISCQSCHGNLSEVGSFKRSGWLDEPDCQSCHHDGQRDTNALDTNGNLKTVTDQRFATNADTPSAGKSLFRFSTGHGGLQCEACHGSTHAIFPSGKPNDNVYSVALQGHEGTISECSSCHNPVPQTINGGPHGMHATDIDWVNRHGDIVEDNNSMLASCATCHGSDFRGSPLSEVKATRQFNVYGGKTFQAKHQIGCYDCHNGPTED